MTDKIKDLGDRIQAAAKKHGVSIDCVSVKPDPVTSAPFLPWKGVTNYHLDGNSTKYTTDAGWEVIAAYDTERLVSLYRNGVFLGATNYDGIISVVAEDTREIVTSILQNWKQWRESEIERERREWAARVSLDRRNAEDAARRACFG